MAEFYTIKDAQADLTIAALNCIVLLAPYSEDPALTLESATDGTLDVPEAYKSLGHFEKAAGVSFANEIDSTDIEAYGEPEPIRTIISKRKTSFEFTMYQNGRLNLELFWAADFSGVEPSEFGGVVLEAPKTPKNVYYRAIVIGLDDRNNREIWTYWLMPKVKLESLDSQELADDGVLKYHPTLVAFKDDELGYSVAQGFAGPGWRDLVHTAGFVAAPTAVSATPAAPSVAVAASSQILVEGSNGINYTPDAKFVSSAPDKASVSSAGLITGVAAGSATVTVTYKPVGAVALTDTVAVTVTA